MICAHQPRLGGLLVLPVSLHDMVSPVLVFCTACASRILNLGGNKLSGEVPTILTYLTNLQ